MVKEEKDKEVKILDVLHYFKTRPKEVKIYKEILDEELIYIKAARPDIVDSWRYYKEFKKICEAL